MTVRPLRAALVVPAFFPGFFSLLCPVGRPCFPAPVPDFTETARFVRLPARHRRFSFSCKTPCPVCVFLRNTHRTLRKKTVCPHRFRAGSPFGFPPFRSPPARSPGGLFVFREDRNTDLSWHLRCMCGSPFRQPQDFCGCFSDSGCFSGGGSFSQKSFSLFPHKAASAGKA